ncbi:uncharacterized protein PHACADRAFT_194755 [Phanerochaete carnosa HHB-10118-sp]|uniref:Uncharacterized protein n=1 Tax=Phanerochaete carnosa (strain HHB-10118-sp) TaxID=650164 RepID=K5V3N1_PHACS|nr:uncharacterized protein PHACADRAFT_194755 [Phanerochaete carnosa HHB-10118-sp]EKM57191.1 hypothetical protein PHACADRAFT_194755 [Phanerochaete carnosa HHB-10118-sp]
MSVLVLKKDLGKAVQIVHKVTNLGGTVGDLESASLIEAMRRLQSRFSYEDFTGLSSYTALTAPACHDMVAAVRVRDLYLVPVLPTLQDQMLASPEGSRIVKERPCVTVKTVDMNYLAILPQNPFGRTYMTCLEQCNVTSTTHEPVMQLYGESRDLYHCLVDFPVNVTSELGVESFEFTNLGLPMTGFAAASGHLCISSAKRTQLFRDAWGLMMVYWEQDKDEPNKEMRWLRNGPSRDLTRRKM